MSSSASEARRCVLGLGANLGNRLANLQDALRRSVSVLPDVRVSSLYESDPVGPPGQPPYYNAVAVGVTGVAPVELLVALKRIEWDLGRRPGPRWGPRPIDLDILWIDGVTLNTPRLTIPHPRIAERPFVLLPLAELAPDLVLAGGRTAGENSLSAERAGLRRIAGPEWLSAISAAPMAVRPDQSTL